MLAYFDGKKLREVRKQQNMSQAELADRARSSICYVRALERHRKRKPPAAVVCKFAISLGVPMETFMRIQFDEDDEFFYQREESHVYIQA